MGSHSSGAGAAQVWCDGAYRDDTSADHRSSPRAAPGRGSQPVFFPDDPIAVDPETQDASGLDKRDISDPYDFVENTFLNPGDRTSQRALNVNTVLFDSSNPPSLKILKILS